MAWTEWRKTKKGTVRRLNKKTGKMETGSLYVCDRINGKVVSRPAGSDRGRAKKMERAAATRRESARFGEVESPPIKTAYDEFEITIKNDDTKSKKTWAGYSWGIDKFLDHIEDRSRRVDSIKGPEIIKFRTRIMQAHCTNGMINILKYVRRFFNFCVKAGYMQINPVVESEALEGFEESDVATYYTDEQARHFIDCCVKPGATGKRAMIGLEFRDIIGFTLATGLREFEIPMVECAKVSESGIEVIGKGRKWRNIPVADEMVVDIIRKHCSPEKKFLFQGWSEDRIRQYWKRLVKKARLRNTVKLPERCRFHDLRHTFASNYLMDGGRLEDLQILLGHSSFATTERYKHIQKSHLDKEMKKMKNLFLRGVPPQFRVAS